MSQLLGSQRQGWWEVMGPATENNGSILLVSILPRSPPVSVKEGSETWGRDSFPDL